MANRKQKSRTCIHCNQDNLVWKQAVSPKTGKSAWILHTISGEMHWHESLPQSQGYYNTETKNNTLTINTETTVAKTEATEEIATMIETTTTTIAPTTVEALDFTEFGQFGEAVQAMHEIGSQTINQTIASVNKIATQTVQTAMNVAREVAEQARPVTHFIEINRYDGSSTTFEGRPHQMLDTLIQTANARVPAMMSGPAGGGKTTAAEMVAEALGLTYYEVPMGPSRTEIDLIGFKNIHGEIIDGFLREPYENGGVVLLDEVDTTDASVLTALNSMISQKAYTFADGRVAKHADFVILIGGNTWGKGENRIYCGRNQLDGATTNRFAKINWDYDEEAEFDWVGQDKASWVSYVQAVRHAASDHQMRLVISPRQSLHGATLLRAGMDAQTVADITLWNDMSDDEQVRLKAIAGSYTG